MSTEKECKDYTWDNAAEGWTDFVRTGKDYLREFVNNPAFFALIGDVQRKKVLDLACGEGYNTRILARRGACVVGVDSAQKLIELAEKEEAKEPLNIKYYQRDASCLKGFSNGVFDLVTCSMALQDMENFEGAIAETARTLKPKGRFIFSIPHPCFQK